MVTTSQLFIGCAGWTVPREHAEMFPKAGSHLQRYSKVFSTVEINSSFYRPHRPATYKRWAEETPDNFRFSVKFPKQITHVQRLRSTEEPMSAFVDQTAHLGEKLGCYLIQLPPSLAYSAGAASDFFGRFRELSEIPAVCEPRHPSWFVTTALDLLAEYQIGLVEADPSPVPMHPDLNCSQPAYLRLHGSPQMYFSSYEPHRLEKVAHQLLERRQQGCDVWCIFDNTAAGAATENALQLQSMLGPCVSTSHTE